VDEIAALLARFRELEPETYVYESADESVIRELEAAFGRPMPPSYRAFLARFGAISILDNSFSGILDGQIDQGRGWAWTDTKCAREWCQLPEHYLVVERESDGFVCLDFGRVREDGECPVIYHMPFRETPFNELGASYGDWLKRNLEGYIEAWSDAED
jgi:antitoxin YobK